MSALCSRRQFLYYKGKLGPAHNTQGTRAHTHRELLREWLWEGELSWIYLCAWGGGGGGGESQVPVVNGWFARYSLPLPAHYAVIHEKEWESSGLEQPIRALFSAVASRQLTSRFPHHPCRRWRESGFGSLRGAPLNISRCLGGGRKFRLWIAD